jgi:outer membrane protein OmpA-like peptidoglycan-associated protein
MVFFDLNKATLVPNAAAILDNVTAAYASCGNRQVTISGYADRSGTAKQNMVMSRERANAVRAYLIAHGVPKANIVTRALEDSQPLIETKKGVKEPQNRRVEITFGPATGS